MAFWERSWPGSASKTLGSPSFYLAAAKQLGMEVLDVEDQTANLTLHYTRVLEETERHEQDLAQKVSAAYIDRMKTGLGHWIDGGRQGYLSWAIFHFLKT